MNILEEIVTQHIIKDPPSKDLMKLFGMINTYPKNATFATQNPDEQVVMVIRKHIFRNASWLFSAAVAFLTPLLISLLISFWDTSFNQDQFLTSDIMQSLNTPMLSALLLFYYGFVATYVYFSFIHWFYDVFIITNERYISIDFDILHGRTIVDIPLSDIIDVSEKVLGFLPTMVGYGNIEFKTTSEKFIVLDNIPSPTWFRDSFVDLIHFIRGKKEAKVEDAKDKDHNADRMNFEEILDEELQDVKDDQKIHFDDKNRIKFEEEAAEVVNVNKPSSKYLEP
jgi:hypothetical protein